MKTQNEIEETWTNGKFRIEFSNPHIQGHSSYLPIENEDMTKIMYLYYNVAVYYKKKTIVEANLSDDQAGHRTKSLEGYHWKKIFSIRIHDFPTIQYFQNIARKLMKEPKDGTWQKLACYNGEVQWQKTYNTMGFAAEDFYELTKVDTTWGKIPYYILSIGKSLNSMPCADLKTVRIILTEKDLGSLLETTEKFMKQAFVQHNLSVIIQRRKEAEKFQKFGAALHVYRDDTDMDNEEKIYGKGIEYSIHAGDTVELYYVRNDKEHYMCGPVLSIYNKGILIDDVPTKEERTIGENKKPGIILFSEIGHFAGHWYSYEQNPYLNCNVQQAEQIFLSSLCDEEIAEITSMKENDAVRKYHNAVISKVWLMRTEHKLPMIVPDGTDTGAWTEDQYNAILHAKNIVKNIRRMLRERTKTKEEKNPCSSE